MIAVTVQEICRASGGEMLAGSPDESVGGVVTDTRADVAGRLFVALTGENFDGNDFLEEALAGGAMGVVADVAAAERLVAGSSGGDMAAVVIAVEETGEALKRIGSLVAAKSDATVIAITGSTGKTSTKDILASLLTGRVRHVASRGSFNNEVGVPLTLVEADEDTEVIVVEMGMQAPGEISELCRIVAPDIAVITNIGPAHLEYAGSIENIAAGKAEIARGLKPGGRLIAPYGEELLAPHLEGLDIGILTFGLDTEADIHARTHEHLDGGRLRCSISCLGEEVEATFNFSAHHQLLNAMAAIGVYRLLGQPLAAVPEAASALNLSRLRGEQLQLDSGAVIINDCYNANPLSMRSSLEYLASVGTGKRTVAILGDMGELGDAAEELHVQVGEVAGELAVDCVIAIGEQAGSYIDGFRVTAGEAETHHYPTVEEAVTGIPALIGPDDVVLVKASRFMQLERVCEALDVSGTAAGGEV